jgi:hypothetical protein
VAFGTSPMLDCIWCRCASGVERQNHLGKGSRKKTYANQEEHISTTTPRPNSRVTNPDSGFEIRLRRHCHFTPPALPIVACGSYSNPLLRILGSVLAVAGVIFAHDTSIENPGAFSGVIALSLTWYNPVSRGRGAWLRFPRNGGPYMNEQLM